ncbi:MAG: tRNA pseudouridine(55) synthase TruB [Holosporales bacterium]|jgi:tRNA pseudouridine55 synthase|nr:tRNA pseudouridine(55) synthase TruB [Holosporales bacterium]
MNKAGIIILDKPAGKSSAFVARIVGKIVGAKKVGHLGTLDPFATGVLPVAINGATKIIQYITPKQKTYVFEIVFGEKRNTGDVTGNVIEISKNIPSSSNIESVLPLFMGEIKQTPHIFSAIKTNGKKAYEIARKGGIPKIKQRNVSIFSIKILKYSPCILEASVSPGTYIRSLTEDIAKMLGTVAYVKTLRRVSDGKFSLEKAVTLDKLEMNRYNLDEVDDMLWNLEDILDDIPVVLIGEHNVAYLLDGKPVVVGNSLDSEVVVLLSQDSGFLAIAEIKNFTAYPKRIIRKVW